MLRALDDLYIATCTRGRIFLNKLKNEERGASDMVAVIAIIVIVLAVAVVFRKQLTEVVTKAFENVTSWIGTGTKDGAGIDTP